ITYVAGTQFLSQQGDPVPVSALTTPDGKPGLKAEYSSRPGFEAKGTPLVTRLEPTIKLTDANLPEEAKTTKTLAVQWTGSLHANATADYLLGIKANAFVRVSVDDTLVAQGWDTQTHRGQAHLEKGRPANVEVSYSR